MNAIVCVHHVRSAQRARKASTNWLSSLPSPTRRSRNSMILSCHYRAHSEPPIVQRCPSWDSPGFRRVPARQASRAVGDHEVVDPLLARPGQPAVPERPYLGRLGHADRQEVRLDQEDRSAWPRARKKVLDRDPSVRDVVKHGARRHEVEVPRRDWPGNDVALRSSRFGISASTSERSRPTAMAVPSGATRRASHSDIVPFPQPTSSVRAPPRCQAAPRSGDASDRAAAT